jgi:putative transposase
MELRKQAHAVYHCDYHLVLPTKYRRKIFNAGVFAYLMIKIREISKFYPEIMFKTVNHDIDHIHMLVSIPPKMSVGSVVRIVKANTSRRMKEKFPFLKDVYWGTDGIWSDGYFASTVGIDEDVIRKYITHQGVEDAGQAKLEIL